MRLGHVSVEYSVQTCPTIEIIGISVNPNTLDPREPSFPPHLLHAQLVEDHLLIKAIQQLWPEVVLHLLKDQRAQPSLQDRQQREASAKSDESVCNYAAPPYVMRTLGIKCPAELLRPTPAFHAKSPSLNSPLTNSPAKGLAIREMIEPKQATPIPLLKCSQLPAAYSCTTCP